MGIAGYFGKAGIGQRLAQPLEHRLLLAWGVDELPASVKDEYFQLLLACHGRCQGLDHLVDPFPVAMHAQHPHCCGSDADGRGKVYESVGVAALGGGQQAFQQLGGVGVGHVGRLQAGPEPGPFFHVLA